MATITITAEQLTKILARHAAWLRGEPSGRQAKLREADLHLADLHRADLRGADLRGTDLRGADLRRADMRGSNLRGADLRWSDMRWAAPSGTNLRRADLRGADLRRADLRWADMRWADLREADLRGAGLHRADLREADLRGAGLNWNEIPVIAEIHRRVYEAASQPDALCMGAWHTCDTTHCRAGWVVTLAGPAGKALEDRLSTSVAAALIYRASDPALERVPDWYATDEDALADMCRLAGLP